MAGGTALINPSTKHTPKPLTMRQNILGVGPALPSLPVACVVAGTKYSCSTSTLQALSVSNELIASQKPFHSRAGTKKWTDCRKAMNGRHILFQAASEHLHSG